ncbi:vitamin K epoxide reductase family protein [Granulicella sibirica]|uniref:Vitamin K epoxide reductase n=1 Tax=Granulicella sibirica TaxID=2479048 RepID=A0A4Q0T3S6_9BACT|nr:vitamin K epoxide reductase family protein [Granulicella sibirica]RXH57562.1 Vitamin K epoxide reductase [Granulicella sibirica]
MKYVLALLAMAGLVVSVLALRVHNMDPNLAPPCAVTEHWDCGAVNHSRFAVFPPRSFDEDPKSSKPHIPVATIGIIGYSLMLLLALLGRVGLVRELALIGFMAAGFLTYLEAFVLEKWCIYCVWSQGIVTVLLLTAIVAVWLQQRSLSPSTRSIS